MLVAVCFDDEPSGLAGEIGDVWPDWKLPPKLVTVEPTVPQMRPEAALTVAHQLPLLAGTNHGPGMTHAYIIRAIRPTWNLSLTALTRPGGFATLTRPGGFAAGPTSPASGRGNSTGSFLGCAWGVSSWPSWSC